MTDDGMAGWVGLNDLCRRRGIDRRRMLRQARKLDGGTGKILARAAQTGTGERPGKWLLNVRRLEAAGGPTRARIDATLEDVQLRVEDLEDAVRRLGRRLDGMSKPGQPASPGAAPLRSSR